MTELQEEEYAYKKGRNLKDTLYDNNLVKVLDFSFIFNQIMV